MYKEKTNICTCIFNIIVSLLVAVAIAAVFFSGLVASIVTLVYITLILGILGLLFLAFKIFCGTRQDCHCINNSSLAVSSIGAIITSLFALTITTLAAASIPAAILVGSVAFFLVSLLISIVDFLICSYCNNNCCNN